MKAARTARNSAVEILRIVFMMLIIGHHYVLHGQCGCPGNSALNKFVIDFFLCAGSWSVSGFILISGYYMSASEFTLRKAIKLISCVYFYSIVSGIIFALWNTAALNGKWSALLFPVFNLNAYWFVTYYLFLMMLSPFMNIVIREISPGNYRKLLLLLLFFSCIVPYATVNNCFMRFITLYFIAGYMRYNVSAACRKPLSCFVTAALLLFCLFILPEKNNCLLIEKMFISIRSLLLLCLPVALLQGVLSLQSFTGNLINVLAGASFGVYLIHDNILLRNWLWNPFLHVSGRAENSYFVVHLVICVSGIYLLSAIIDFFRQQTIEKIWMKTIDFVFGNLRITIK